MIHHHHRHHNNNFTIPETLNAALAKSLVESQCFRVHGQQTGYRNKICYSIAVNSPRESESSRNNNNNNNNNNSNNNDYNNSSNKNENNKKTFAVSSQAMTLLNEIAIFINSSCEEFVADRIVEESSLTNDEQEQQQQPQLQQVKQQWLDFFVEVTPKITRKNEVMVKLAVTHDCADKFLASSRSLSTRFVSKIIEKFPMIRCFVLHIAPPGLKKGTKFGNDDDDQQVNRESPTTSRDGPDAVASPNDGSRYVPIFENRTSLLDLTPNGVPVQISADSFTEINYGMEDEMHKATLEFLKIPARSDQYSSTASTAAVPSSSSHQQQEQQQHRQQCERRHDRCGLFMGRDCNVQYLSVQHFYGDRVLLTTGCPRAFRDAAAMDLPNFASVPKDKISEAIFGHAFLAADRRYAADDRRPSCSPFASEKSTTQPSSLPKWDFIVTAGRHGIVPTASEAMISEHVVSRVANFLYTSCNLDSLTRDLHVFRRAYVIANVRSFDFFPGTRYTMTMVHLIPRRSSTSLTRNLLVLPISLPGCGKSSCSSAFKKAVNESDPLSIVRNQSQQKSKNKKSNISLSSSSAQIGEVKRALNRRREMLFCEVFERDEVFQKERSVPGKSLSSTKVEVHSQLLNFLSLLTNTGRRHNNADDDDDDGGAVVAVVAPDPFAVQGGVYILDSSNGSIEQRKEYRRLWQAECCSTTSSRVEADTYRPVIEIYFKAEGESEQSVLLERCLARENHPAFPSSDRELARKKIDDIAKSIEPSPSCFVIEQVVGEHASWERTFEQFAWICFLSYFTCDREIPIAKMILKETSSVKLF